MTTQYYAVILCPSNVTSNHVAWSKTIKFESYESAKTYAESCYGSCDSVLFVGTYNDAFDYIIAKLIEL